MKIVVRVKLLPASEEAVALRSTLLACNRAADQVSRVAFDKREFSKFGLQKVVYADLKACGLGAQAAIRTIKKVCDAYTTLQANIRAGNLGRPGSKLRVKAESKPVTFRPEAAQPYDDRLLTWQHDAGTVSIWTASGRLKGVRFVGSADHLKVLREYRKGESDLVERDGEFYLLATCEVPEAEVNADPTGFLGVDLGIVNIATTSDGDIFSGRQLNRYRARQARLRAKLQKKGTKSAKRLLKKRARRERRFAADTNHVISKRIVAEAERTSRAIALEDLQGIRTRARLKRPQRAAVHSWAFAQLGQFLAYKARRAGVPVVFVDPAYTSRQCSECDYIDKRNRASQARFQCRSCGVVAHADLNASRNIARKGETTWIAGRESRVPTPA
ncbi:RNA-guided endonuclease InsQ/TnpB family protein [Actinacidiphila soli]|uniref:RNA-guided endonuclease InsQ/TnpB family protein n=1 Tax=Actinacidiphila soli TaxID=2487275 RepID=UPI0019D09FC7|nr:RNA-guided endonuclease TnpB family protein [Actinacidiphila soli]